MSLENIIVVEKDWSLSTADIERKAKELGYQISIADCDLKTHSGFLPVRHEDIDTGFEYYFLARGSDDLTSLDSHFANYSGCMTVTRGDFHEASVALIFLNSVADLTNGAYLCPNYDILKKPGEVRGYLDNEISACLSEWTKEEQRKSEREARQERRRKEREDASRLIGEDDKPELPDTDKSRGLFSRLFGRKK
ncbi:hypothetical protein [Parasphingopyxis marina]|uniref:Uncharacterized protein n=1 Tax=Parasphingopyxis marina TaxID=2761622 RepID=A0A842HW71_9SPHN|nr:hypothetical protein [Parasphingopyxis marina]MBC2776190.1 hypothetical protein [Parasphingopyxis marina]